MMMRVAPNPLRWEKPHAAEPPTLPDRGAGWSGLAHVPPGDCRGAVSAAPADASLPRRRRADARSNRRPLFQARYAFEARFDGGRAARRTGHRRRIRFGPTLPADAGRARRA